MNDELYRGVLASFAKSEGNSTILAQELQSRDLISDLPRLLTNPTVIQRLIDVFGTVHSLQVLERFNQRGKAMDAIYVHEIFIMALNDLAPTPEIKKVIRTLEDQLAALRLSEEQLPPDNID